MDWKCGSSGTVPALQSTKSWVQTQSHQKKKKECRTNRMSRRSWREYKCDKEHISHANKFQITYMRGSISCLLRVVPIGWLPSREGSMENREKSNFAAENLLTLPHHWCHIDNMQPWCKSSHLCMSSSSRKQTISVISNLS
jgi:hypothetical protein